MKCQVLAGKCLQQPEEETRIPRVLLSFILPRVLFFFPLQSLFCSHYLHSPDGWKHLACVRSCVRVCVRKMFCNIAALRHPSRDAGRGQTLVSLVSFLILPHCTQYTQVCTHTHTVIHLGSIHSHTHTIHD